MGIRRTIPQPPPPPPEHLKYYFQNAFKKYYGFRWEKTSSIKKIEEYSSILLEGDNITISRFNDGEWAYALDINSWKLPPMKNRNKGYEDILYKVGQKLLQIIESQPQYFISIDKVSLTQDLSQEKVFPYVKSLNFIGSGIFNTWSLYTGFKDLFKVFNQRKTIVVGPEFLKDLPFEFTHYKTPLKGVNYEIDSHVKEIEKLIKTIWEPNMVIIYSCSFLAKISLDTLYQKYGDTITQLDMGASLNPFVGYSNRPWHDEIILQLKKHNTPQLTRPSINKKIHNNNQIGNQKIYKMIGNNVKIHPLAYIEDDVEIGDNTQIGPFCIVRKGAKIGTNCKFTAYCEIRENVIVGDNTSMGSRCTISANASIGSDTTIKYGFVLTDTPDLKEGDKKVVKGVGNKVLIGANVTLMPGFSIGNNSIIGACSQVRSNIGENEIWYGSPAKFYKTNE